MQEQAMVGEMPRDSVDASTSQCPLKDLWNIKQGPVYHRKQSKACTERESRHSLENMMNTETNKHFLFSPWCLENSHFKRICVLG